MVRSKRQRRIGGKPLRSPNRDLGFSARTAAADVGRESDSVGKNIIVRASVADSGSKGIDSLAQNTRKRKKEKQI